MFVFIVIYLIDLLLSGNLSAFKRRYGQYWFVVVHLRGKTCGDLSKISLSHVPLSKLIGLVFNLSDLTTYTEVYVCAYMFKKNRDGRGESVLSAEAFVNTLIISQLPTKIAISAINFSA